MCVEGRGDHTNTKTVSQTVSVEVKYRNTQCRACGKLNISKSKNSNFELSTKCILIKNLNLTKTVFKFIFLSFFLFYFILFNIFLFISFNFFLFFFFNIYFFYLFLFNFYFILLFLFYFLICKYVYFNIFLNIFCCD